MSKAVQQLIDAIRNEKQFEGISPEDVADVLDALNFSKAGVDDVKNGLSNIAGGWSAQPVTEVYNGKLITKIEGYTGGTGTLPDALAANVGKYVSDGGYTDNKDEAIDFLPKNAQPFVPFPYLSQPASDIQRKVCAAVKEIYISDYDANCDYYLVQLARDKDLTAYGYPPHRYGYKIVKKDRASGAETSYLFAEYGRTEPLGDDFVQSNDKNIWILLDWKAFEINEGLDADPAEIYKITPAVGDIVNAPRIAAHIAPPPVINTDNLATKSDLDTAISGTLTQPVADVRYQPKSAAAYAMAQSDSRYVQIGAITNAQFKTVNAGDFGFLPTKSAAENVAALNSAIAGGNKTVVISNSGDYAIREGVRIPSNTKIVALPGVAFKLTENTWNIFINDGAEARIFNENITLEGIFIKANGFKAYPDSGMTLFGLRGLINMFYVRNLKLINCSCTDMGDTNWLIHICRVEDALIDSPKIAGMKDGIHIGSCKRVTVRNYYSQCYDDSLGLNCFDYPESNPEIGDIEDFYVDGMTFEHAGQAAWGAGYGGRIINLQMGRVGNLAAGMQVMRGDAFNYNGRTYVCVATDDGNAKTCNVMPTVTVFNNNQHTSDGIYWRLQKTSTSGSASIKNLAVRNLKAINPTPWATIICKYFAGQDGSFSRTIHPNIPASDYPEAVVKFENVSIDGYAYFAADSKLGHKTTLRNFSGIRSNGNYPDSRFISSADTVKRSFWNIKDSDFTTFDRELNFGSNSEVIISDNLQAATLNILSAARINGNTDVNFSSTAPQKGDEFKLNGVKKIYTGSTWKDLN